MSNYDPYEQDREDNVVNERHQWAEDHGYVHGTCRIHGGFWTDSGDGCPSCPDEDGRYDLGDIDQQPDQLEIGLPLGDYPIEHFGDSVEDSIMEQAAYAAFKHAEDIRNAAKQYNQQFLFFMDAMKRNGVL